MTKRKEATFILDYKYLTKETAREITLGGEPEEIRIRANKPIEYIYESKQSFGHIVSEFELRTQLELLTDYSWYNLKPQLEQGYFTIEGGHRIGVTGRNKTSIGTINIRVARQKKGIGLSVIPYIRNDSSIYNTYIISPPGEGKTTMLRDIIRILSDGADGKESFKVAVVDERSEIGACYKGIPQNDLGKRCDILDGYSKTKGMKILLRSMSPQIIAVDELGTEDDYNAVNEIINSGIKIIGTIHANRIDELKEKKNLPKVERYIFVKRDKYGKRKYEIYDSEGRQYV